MSPEPVPTKNGPGSAALISIQFVNDLFMDENLLKSFAPVCKLFLLRHRRLLNFWTVVGKVCLVLIGVRPIPTGYSLYALNPLLPGLKPGPAQSTLTELHCWC